MSRVAREAFSCAQKRGAVQAGHARRRARSRPGALPRCGHCAATALGGLVDLDVDGLEGRAQQRAKRVVVVDEQEAQSCHPPCRPV